MHTIEITTPRGKSIILIKEFPAMDGWDIEAKFRDFCLSNDKDFRRTYTLEVLGYAAVQIKEGNEIVLKTDAVIDNHLCCWQNVKTVFEEILKHNGIDPDAFVESSTMQYWERVGNTVGTSILASIAKLMDPALAAHFGGDDEQNKE